MFEKADGRDARQRPRPACSFLLDHSEFLNRDENRG